MMDKNERQILRNYLLSFESRKTGHKPKSIILLELLEKYADDVKVIGLLKKKMPSEDARRMAITRLREKMLTTLTLDVNMDRDGAYDEHSQAMVAVANGKLQGRLLIGRGQRDIGFFVLDRSIQLAKKFELYDDLVDMLTTERQFVKAWKGSDEAYYKIDAEIANYSKCRDAVNLSKKYYEEITNRYGFKGLNRARPDKDQLTYLRLRMDELSKAFEETSSATVGYNYYFLLIEYCQIQNDLQQASDHLNSLAQMLENNPAIRRKVRLATVYANLGANELWMYHYKEAEQYISTSLTFLRPNTRNYAVMTEYLFYTRFYSGQLNEAKEVLENLVSSKLVDQSDFRKAVRSYLLACVAFARQDFKKVNQYLLTSQEIGKDKEGWNIGSRVLSIMLAIEQNKFDLADSQIINLRQFIKEGLKGIDIRSRDVLILEVLIELRKKSYDFKAAISSSKDNLKLLSTNDLENGWAVQIPEMICFHTWFRSKLENRPYDPNYDPIHIFRPF